MGAWILAVGTCAVDNDDHSIDRQPTIRENARDQPAFQADLIVTAGKADIGEAKAQAGWSFGDRFGRLVNELFGDVARDRHISKGQQTRQDQQAGDGSPPAHAYGTPSSPIWSRGRQSG